MGRFRDIRRGARLNEALTNYQAYLARPVSTALGAYKARPPAIALMIKPFGFELPGTTQARVNGNAGWSTVYGVADVAAATDVAPANANSGELSGFTPARVVWFRSTTKTVSTGTSKFTSMSYRKYEGDRFSMPFGQKAGTDREFVVAAKIKTALKGEASFVVNRVSITPERNRDD